MKREIQWKHVQGSEGECWNGHVEWPDVLDERGRVVGYWFWVSRGGMSCHVRSRTTEGWTLTWMVTRNGATFGSAVGVYKDRYGLAAEFGSADDAQRHAAQIIEPALYKKAVKHYAKRRAAKEDSR